MNNKQEGSRLTPEEIKQAYLGSDYHSSFKLPLVLKHSLDRVANAQYQKFTDARLDRPELREDIAKTLASMDNWRYEDLPVKDKSFTDGVTQSHYLRRADQLLQLLALSHWR